MTDSQPSPIVWGFPGTSRKAHAFRRSDAAKWLARSLCGKWGYVLMNPERMDPENGVKSPDDCGDCRRRVDKLVAKTNEGLT